MILSYVINKLYLIDKCYQFYSYLNVLQILNTPKTPLEIAKASMKKLAKDSPMKFVNNNSTNTITSSKQVSNLKQEAKREQLLQRGIHSSNNFDDCLKTMTNILEMDISSRKDKRPNGGDILPGIVRRCHFVSPSGTINAPTIAPDFILHDRSTCAFIGELCEQKNVIMTLDTTAGMTNFPDTPFDGKMQHSIMTVQYKETVISAAQNEFTRPYDFSSFPVTERASSWNTASAVESWIVQWMIDVKLSTMDVLGREITPNIAMLKVDNALQLPTGMILALREDHMIDSARTYNNIVIPLLIEHEYDTLSLSPTSGEYKASCDRVMTKIRYHAPFAAANCKVHTFLYRRDAYRNMKVKPIELKMYYQQVNKVYRNVAYAFYVEMSLSRLIVRICVLITIFETKMIPCQNVGGTMKSGILRKSHDTNAASAMATAMHSLVERGVQTLFESVNGNVDRMIAEEHSKVGSPNLQRFLGTHISSTVLNTLKSLKFSLTYPISIDRTTKTCTVRTAILYSPYKLRTDGSRDVDISPQLVGGFETTLSIPFRGRKIRNPLHSKALGKYWRKELDRVGLTGNAIVGVAERAWDRNIGGTTMSLEAHLQHVKTQSSRYKESIRNIPSWMMTRWEESNENGALMSAQIQGHDSKMRRREYQKLIREEDMEPIWQRGAHATTKPLKECWNKMIKVLEAAMTVERDSEDGEKYQFSKNNVLSMWRVLEYASCSFDGENLPRSEFYKWQTGERRRMLPVSFTLLVEEMHEKYVVGQQKFETGRRLSKVFYDEETGKERIFLGTVAGYDVGRGIYKVVYDDGDWEELFEDSLSDLLLKPSPN